MCGGRGLRFCLHGDSATGGSLGTIKQLLNVIVVSRSPLHDQVAPVDAKGPADEVGRGEELDQTDCELSLVDVCIADAGTSQGAGAGQQNVENKADVSPDQADLRKVRDELPHADILRVELHCTLLKSLNVDVVARNLEGLRLFLRHF